MGGNTLNSVSFAARSIRAHIVTINRGGDSIYEVIRKAGFDP